MTDEEKIEVDVPSEGANIEEVPASTIEETGVEGEGDVSDAEDEGDEPAE